ncbi:hypothetical protein CHH69_18325, partial [Terribacillus saccharophilus]
PVTPETMQIKVQPFYLPRTIIKDGKIIYEELAETTKDEAWIVSYLNSAYQTEVKNVLLATTDKNENLNVFLYR